jgi:hypothetical protein
MGDKPEFSFEELRDVLRGTPYKVLDCRRKGLLALPGRQLNIFMAYWMHENGMDEAWPSTETIAKEVKLKIRQVRRLRSAMRKAGWMVEEGGYASDRWHTSTVGARQVSIYRVDDPSKSVKSDLVVRDSDIPNNNENSDSKNVKNDLQPARSDLTGKGSCSGSGSGSEYKSKSGCVSGSSAASQPDPKADFVFFKPKPKPTPSSDSKPKPVTSEPVTQSSPAPKSASPLPVPVGDEVAPSPVPPPPSPKHKVGKNGVAKLAPDGAPYPVYFDSCAGGNPARTAWIFLHTPKDQREALGRDAKFDLLMWLCPGVDRGDGKDRGLCLNLGHRKLGNRNYCPDCLPWTEEDRKKEERHTKLMEEMFKDDPAAREARLRRYMEEDEKRQARMEKQRIADRERAIAEAKPGSMMAAFLKAGGETK